MTSAERCQRELFRIDSDWPEMFSRLNRRYGIWGLAWLESVFRLADHMQSSVESNPAATNDHAEVPAHA